MWVVRPVRLTDHNALSELATALGPGMTTLPDDRAALGEKIEASIASFDRRQPPEQSQFFMVLEDEESGAVLGTAAVYPSIGRPYGFFSYHVNRLIHHSQSIDFGLDTEVLHLSNEYTGTTEIGTLAVSPALRRGGAGRLLAQSRYMLMAAFPDLFADRVIAEMRGWQEPDGSNPFWSAVGERFFHMDFAKADRISAVNGAEFIADLMPKHPIYLGLLPESARAAVGRAHASSAIAMAMLIDEGFRYENCVDVFDAGPQVVAQRARIRTVAQTRIGLTPLDGSGDQPVPGLIATQDLANFRVIRSESTPGSDAIGLDAAALAALGGAAEAGLCFSPLDR
jgi:arginine N-succinyltransferase